MDDGRGTSSGGYESPASLPLVGDLLASAEPNGTERELLRVNGALDLECSAFRTRRDGSS